MKILLVRPRQPEETIGLQHIMVVEPLELEVIGALVRPPDEVVLVDLLLESEPLERFLEAERPDLVGFTGYITNVGVVRDLARRAKRFNPSLRTVVGGPHAEVCPGDFDLPEIDFRVVRNATTQFPRLLAHLSEGAPRPEGVLAVGQACDETRLPDFDFTFPEPRRELTARYRDRYFYFYQDRVALMKTSFGCPFSCRFCFCRAMTRGRYHARDLDAVLEELAGIREEEIYIVDDDFLCSRERVLAFVEGVERRGLQKRFQVYGRADFIAANPEVIARFRAAGLRVVIVGLESCDDADLEAYGKGLRADTNVRAMEVLNQNGIDAYATFILGPDWARDDFDRLDRFLRRLKIRFANLQPLTPLPGIAYQVEESRLVVPRDDWPRWDLAHVTIRPSRLSLDDFYRETLRLYRRMIWRPANILKNLKYPLHMQLRILRGLARVRRQYQRERRGAALHA
jgi:radical SAM superfamily enzyme YgiQ (UPF0313 family)